MCPSPSFSSCNRWTNISSLWLTRLSTDSVSSSCQGSFWKPHSFSLPATFLVFPSQQARPYLLLNLCVCVCAHTCPWVCVYVPVCAWVYTHECVCVCVAHISQLTHENQKIACKVIPLPTPHGSPRIQLVFRLGPVLPPQSQARVS